MRTYDIYDQVGKLGTQKANGKNDAVHLFSRGATTKPFWNRAPIVGALVAYDIQRDSAPRTRES